MADADGATEINDFNKVYEKLQKVQKGGLGLIAGSRNQLTSDVKKERKFIRNILGLVSNIVVQQICGVKLKDT